MKDFAIPRREARNTSEKTSLSHVARFCAHAFCVIFTLLYFLVQIYEHAKNIG